MIANEERAWFISTGVCWTTLSFSSTFPGSPFLPFKRKGSTPVGSFKGTTALEPVGDVYSAFLLFASPPPDPYRRPRLSHPSLVRSFFFRLGKRLSNFLLFSFPYLCFICLPSRFSWPMLHPRVRHVSLDIVPAVLFLVTGTLPLPNASTFKPMQSDCWRMGRFFCGAFRASKYHTAAFYVFCFTPQMLAPFPCSFPSFLLCHLFFLSLRPVFFTHLEVRAKMAYFPPNFSPPPPPHFHPFWPSL